MDEPLIKNLTLYDFEIKEIENGWVLYNDDHGEFYSTLNELCEELLHVVDEAFPMHRATGSKRKQREARERAARRSKS